jgi:hypothetical protein
LDTKELGEKKMKKPEMNRRYLRDPRAVIALFIFVFTLPLVASADIIISSLPYEITQSNQTYRLSGSLSSPSSGILIGNHVQNVTLDLATDTITFGYGGGNNNYGVGIYWNPSNITVRGGWIIHNTGGSSTAADNNCIFVGNPANVLIEDVNAIIDGIDGKCFMNNGSAYNIEISGGTFRSISTNFTSRCTTTGSVIWYLPEKTLTEQGDFHIKIHDVIVANGPHTGISILHSHGRGLVEIYNNQIQTDGINELYPVSDGNTCHSSGNAYGISIYGLLGGSKIYNNVIRSGTSREGCQGILLQDCKGEAGNPVEIFGNDILVTSGPTRVHSSGKVSALYWRYVPGEAGTWNRYNYIHNNLFRVKVDTDTNTAHIGRLAEAISIFFKDSCDNNIFEKNHVEVLAGSVTDFIEIAAIGFGIEDTLIAGYEAIKNNKWQYNYYKAPKNPVAFGNSRGHPGNNILLYKDTIDSYHTGSDSTTIVFDQTGAYLNHSTGNKLRDCVFLNNANDNDIIFPFQAFSDADGLGQDVRYERTLNVYAKGYNNLPVTSAQVWVVNSYGDTVLTGTTNSGGRVSGVVTYNYRAKDPLPEDGYDLEDSLAYNNFTLKTQRGSDSRTVSFAVTATSANDTLTLSSTYGDGSWGSGSEEDCGTAPSSPFVSTPANGGEVGTRPTLCVFNSNPGTCQNPLTYDFQIASNSFMSGIITQGLGIGEGSVTTCFTSSLDLSEGQTYYWRARAYNGTAYSGWSSVQTFVIEGGANNIPTAPSAYTPSNGSDVGNLRPVLTVNNSYDADGDYMTYQFQVSMTSGFSSIFTQALGVLEGSSRTSWTVNLNLNNHTTYFWRARSYDGHSYSPWSSVWSFHTNDEGNSTPSIPELSYPVAGGNVNTLLPILVFDNSVDQEGDPVTYQIQVSPNNGFVTITAQQNYVPEDESGSTSWQVSNTLENDEDYWWRVRAYDGTSYSSFASPSIFFTSASSSNSQPTKPSAAEPEYAVAVTDDTPTLIVYNSSDDDGDGLVYYFEVWNENLTNLIASSPTIAEGLDTTTSWTVSSPLDRAATYYWRCRSYDGTSYAPWMNLSYFYLTSGTPNTRPVAPVLYLPINNEILLGASHIIMIFNTTDPDYDPLTYEFKISSDELMFNVVEMITGMPQGGYLTTSYLTTADFTDGSKYYWSSRAYDGYDWSGWSGTRCFTHYDIAVGAEDIPIALYPLQNTNIPSIRPQFQLQSTETDIGVYFYFEVADNAEFYNPIVSGPVEGEMPVTMWIPESDLTLNDDYYWRARAENSGWFEPIGFSISANIHIAPNPFRPYEHGNGVVFKNLPQGADIKIATLNGDIIKEFNDIDGPELNWDVTNEQGFDLASGVYLYYITSDTGSVSGKLAVIR